MIIKSHEIKNKDISKFRFFLVYGENEGLKKDVINKIRNRNDFKEIKYEETQILNNKSEFYNEVNNRSLFDKRKTYLIERCSDKISLTSCRKKKKLCRDVEMVEMTIVTVHGI